MVALLFYFILVFVYKMHQVLVGLPQGVGGLTVLFVLFCLHLILFDFTLFS
jgi:hypothetical protein